VVLSWRSVENLLRTSTNRSSDGRLWAAVVFSPSYAEQLMAISVVLLLSFAVLLAAAAISDLATFTIPNVIPGSMIGLFIILVLELALAGHAMSLTGAGFHLLAGVAGLLVGIGLFAAGWIGGGDAKLFAAVSLWLGWGVLLKYALTLSLLGGALTFGLLVLRRFMLPARFAAWPWLARLADPKAGIPYGVALAAAALMVLPDSELFRIVSAS
jgi:prepilin peptidase CpaA